VTPVLNGGFIPASAASAGLRFRPNPNIYGNYVFQAQAALSPTVEGIGGDVASAPIIITPVADTPRITTTSVDEGAQSTSGLVILPNSNDGAEVSHYRIAAVIGGTLYLHDGVTTVNVGQISLPPKEPKDYALHRLLLQWEMGKSMYKPRLVPIHSILRVHGRQHISRSMTKRHHHYCCPTT
jgi:hypothetical protein